MRSIVGRAAALDDATRPVRWLVGGDTVIGTPKALGAQMAKAIRAKAVTEERVAASTADAHVAERPARKSLPIQRSDTF